MTPCADSSGPDAAANASSDPQTTMNLPPSFGRPFAMQYDRLRDRLRELSNAPTRDMAAIDSVLHQLDEAHAAFKAHHATAGDSQRY